MPFPCLTSCLARCAVCRLTRLWSASVKNRLGVYYPETCWWKQEHCLERARWSPMSCVAWIPCQPPSLTLTLPPFVVMISFYMARALVVSAGRCFQLLVSQMKKLISQNVKEINIFHIYFPYETEPYNHTLSEFKFLSLTKLT